MKYMTLILAVLGGTVIASAVYGLLKGHAGIASFNFGVAYYMLYLRLSYRD